MNRPALWMPIPGGWSWRFSGRRPCPRTGRSIIVTHDNRIFNFADRIARMDDGRIVLVEPQVAHP